MYAVNRLKKNGLKRTKIVTVLRVSLLTQHTQRVTTSHAQAKQNTTARKRKHGAAWTTGRAAFSCTIVQFHKKQLTNNALSTKIVHSLSLRFSHSARHEPKHTPNIFKQRRHAAVCKQSKNIAWENSWIKINKSVPSRLAFSTIPNPTLISLRKNTWNGKLHSDKLGTSSKMTNKFWFFPVWTTPRTECIL